MSWSAEYCRSAATAPMARVGAEAWFAVSTLVDAIVRE